MIAFSPLFGVVFDRAALESELWQPFVGVHFVSSDRGALFYVFDNQRQQRLALNVWDDASHDFSIPFCHSKNAGLFGVFTGSPKSAVLATDVGLIDLNMTRQTVVTVCSSHVLADFAADPPSGLVGDCQLPLKFLGRNTMTGSGKEVHGVEPLLKRCSRAFKRSSSHWVDVMSTPRTLKRWLAFDSGELAVLGAFRAIKLKAVTYAHQLIQTGIIIRESFEKVSNRELSHHFLLLRNYNARVSYICHGDNHL